MYICLCLRVLPIRMKIFPDREQNILLLPLTQPGSGKQTLHAKTVSRFNSILIDDDRIQLQLTTAMLERPGVTVTCCHHPEELSTN